MQLCGWGLEDVPKWLEMVKIKDKVSLQNIVTLSLRKLRRVPDLSAQADP